MSYFSAVPDGSIQGLLTYNNAVTYGFFGLFLLIAIFTIMFIGTKSVGLKTEKALVTSAFPTFLASVFLSILGVVQGETIAVTAIIVIVGILILALSRNG